MLLNKTGFILLLAVVLCITGCAQSDQGTVSSTPAQMTRAGRLTPYAAASPTVTGTPGIPATQTPQLPSATPTPVTHVVVKGEDMSGLALRYGIDLAELLAANPTVNPRIMSVGTVLIIPAHNKQESTSIPDAANAPLQTPTPVAVEIGSIDCIAVEDGGTWCFQPVRNQQTYPVEGLTAIFNLSGSQGDVAQSQVVSPLLDLIPPGAALPLAAYFPAYPSAPISQPPTASSQLVSALPNRDDGRYLRSHAEKEKVIISQDGLSATITLDVIIDQPDSRARRVWVAATAYNRQGQIIGVRRWEKPDKEPIATGESQAVTMYVYSVAGEIDRVELVVESRP